MIDFFFLNIFFQSNFFITLSGNIRDTFYLFIQAGHSQLNSQIQKLEEDFHFHYVKFQSSTCYFRFLINLFPTQNKHKSVYRLWIWLQLDMCFLPRPRAVYIRLRTHSKIKTVMSQSQKKGSRSRERRGHPTPATSPDEDDSSTTSSEVSKKRRKIAQSQTKSSSGVSSDEGGQSGFSSATSASGGVTTGTTTTTGSEGGHIPSILQQDEGPSEVLPTIDNMSTEDGIIWARLDTLVHEDRARNNENQDSPVTPSQRLAVFRQLLRDVGESGTGTGLTPPQ